MAKTLKSDVIEIKGKPKDGKVKVVKYDRSFLSRLIQHKTAKPLYAALKNYCLSFQQVKSRPAWGAESFSSGKDTVVKMVVYGGTLCVCLALSPDRYAQAQYPHKDCSAIKAYEATPLMTPVLSAADLKRTRRLIADAFTERCVYTVEFPEERDYLTDLAYAGDDALVKRGLIKVTESMMEENAAERALANAIREEKEASEEMAALLPKKAAPKKAKRVDGEEEALEEVLFELAEDPSAEETTESAEASEPVEEEAKAEGSSAVEEPATEEAADEEMIEEVVFDLAEEEARTPEEGSEEEDDVEEVIFDLAEEEAEEEEDIEDVVFELVESGSSSEEASEKPESYGAEALDEETVTLRKYVRGFTAKMRQGDQERKDYYATIKARLLSFKGVKARASFSGDTFKKGQRQLLKSRIRGKTLCLFFALDTDEYKQTVYRQQYKGDTKAYADTPMMVRVKSEQGLKRALLLVDELEKIYLLKEGGNAPSFTEIRGSYLYEETPALVEQGLIKTRLVKVSKLEAEILLNKKGK